MSGLIEISNLRVQYRDTLALDIKNLTIDTQKTTALLGFNGSGKSTLLRVIAGLLKPTSGSVKICGKELCKMSQEELKRIAVLLPEPFLLKRSVRENFRFALASRGVLSEFDERVGEALELVGLGKEFLDKRHYELSSGQNKRVAFALTLCLRSWLNLLDEPTNAVDASTARLFAKAITYSKAQYGSNFIIASHDEKWLSALSDESLFLHKGRVSKFELKNVFAVSNGVIDFAEVKINLPSQCQNAHKVAINQNLIKISTTPFEGAMAGILHSFSLYFGENALVKIHVGDGLLKCIIAKQSIQNEELIVGSRLYFSLPDEAFLSIE